MPRPRKERTIGLASTIRCFRPCKRPYKGTDKVDLEPGELEALRLVNLEGLGQRAAAEQMGVHQSTFQRILSSARKKTTDALINGKAIAVGGVDE